MSIQDMLRLFLFTNKLEISETSLTTPLNFHQYFKDEMANNKVLIQNSDVIIISVTGS